MGHYFSFFSLLYVFWVRRIWELYNNVRYLCIFSYIFHSSAIFLYWITPFLIINFTVNVGVHLWSHLTKTFFCVLCLLHYMAKSMLRPDI
uniref:Uncharacterized protein n=1 Tax=Anguilla anguilla TaxID=7936 RepID=A0A0E9XT87_ANGAN